MSPKSGRPGFTLIEVMIAAFLISVGVLAMMALIPTSTRLTETTQDGNLAMNGILQTSEAIAQYARQDFDYVWRAYNTNPNDDPNGTGTAPGATFAVTGLQDASGSNVVGSITFFIDETVTDTRVGLPRDLNRNGVSTDTDVSGSYTLLPFVIAVDWKDGRGLMRHSEIVSQVAEY